MFKKLATVALCVSSFVAASDTFVAAKYLMASSQGYNVSHDRNGFKVNGQRVHTYDLDPALRGVKSSRQLKDLFKSDRTKLAVSKVGNDYALKRYEQLKGGGPFGAWLGSWIGYGSVMSGQKLITAGLTYATVLVCPPAAPVVAAVSDTILTVVAQPIAITAAVAGGIAGGVATGPM